MPILPLEVRVAVDPSEIRLRGIRHRDMGGVDEDGRPVIKATAFVRRPHLPEPGLSIIRRSHMETDEAFFHVVAADNVWAVVGVKASDVLALGLRVEPTGPPGHATISGLPDPSEGEEAEAEGLRLAVGLEMLSSFVCWRPGRGPDDVRERQRRLRDGGP